MKIFHWIYIVMLLLIFILLVLIHLEQRKTTAFNGWVRDNFEFYDRSEK